MRDELNQYRIAAISRDPSAMSAVYAKTYSSQEVTHLKQVIKKMQQESSKLEMDMSHALSDIKEKLQVELNEKDETIKKYSSQLQELLISLSSKSKVYQESSQRDANKIAALEKELKQLNLLSNANSLALKESCSGNNLLFQGKNL